MRIIVESSVLARTKKTGVDYYAQDLLREAVKQMPGSTFYLCYLSFLTKKPSELGIRSKNVISKRARFFPGKLYNFLERYITAIPYDLIFRIKADVVFYPNFIRWPLVSIKKSAVVVYDLAYLDYPSVMIDRHRKYLTKFVPKSIASATHVVTISENTKQRIMYHYKTDEAKITVITPAINHSLYRPVDSSKINKIREKYNIDSEYLLYLGTIEPRKNITGIIESYKKLSSKHKDKYKLVLAGGKGWLDEDINMLINSLGDKVIRTGYVDDRDKPALYGGAKLFIYPSFYEGWGMQILEAMACGTPVITADNSSLPEAGGKAAVYVRAGNDRQLTKSIENLLGDKDLYNKKVKAGIEHSKNFTWEKSGRRLKEVFEELNSQS